MRWTVLLIALVVLTPSVAGAVTFDDGMVHIIDVNNSFPFEIVEVGDGPGGQPTTLIVTVGGEVGRDLHG